ncbi:MAG: PAS domain-containing protein [Prochlorotrichaceae cyanobacterium]
MKVQLFHVLAACLPILFWPGSVSLAQSPPETLQVGIYQNPPKIFLDEEGEPAGFWVDILQEIARREQWTIVYVPCEWEVCLRSLTSGELDLMPDVAYSAERDQDFDFNQEVVLSSWSEVYVHPSVIVNSLLDLDQKRVAVLSSSVQEGDLLEQARNFGLTLHLVEVSSFAEMFEQISSGAVDAGMANVFFGRWNAQNYNVEPTNLVFEPNQLYFAVPSGDPQALIPRLDRQIQDLTADRNSIYYRSNDRWLHPHPHTLWIHLQQSWKRVLLVGLTTIIGLFAIWIRTLRREILQRRTVEAQLLQSQQDYSSLVSALPVGIFRADAHGQNIYSNDRCCEIVGLSPEECLGYGWLSGLHPEDQERIRLAWAEAQQTDSPFRQEYRFLKPNGQVVWVDGQCEPERNPQGEIIGYVGSLTDISDRKQAEYTLQIQDERLRLAMQSAGMTCWEHNFKTREINLWGRYTPEGWTPESWLVTLEDFYQDIHPEDREQVQIAYALAVSKQTNVTMEYRLLLPDHEPLWLLSIGQVQRNAQGRPDRMVGICLDITARKVMEAELRNSEQRFRRAIENAPFPIMIHAEDGEVLQINGAWTSLTGYSHADLPTTRHWTTLAYGDYAEDILARIMTQCYQLETRWDEGDFQIKTRDGQKRIWHFHTAPLGLLPDGRRFVISMAIDMTHRRQAEAALREREAFLRELTNSVPGAIIHYVLHADGSDRVMYMSPGCQDLWEVQPQDLEKDAQLLWNLVHPEDLAAMQASILASAEHLTPWRWEWRITTAITRQEKWVQGRGNPQRLANGEVVWTTVILDISDRKQAELALLKAKEEAEQASQYKTSFLATMSHEIRTPMNGVLGMLNLLNITPLNETQRSYLHMAQVSAESLLALINDILDFSKIEAGKMDLEEIDFDLLQELEDCAQTMATMAYSKGLEFILAVHSFPTARLLGDPRRLRQILTNLVSNAIKFTNQGTITLDLDCPPAKQSPEDDRQYWTIAVTDTGIGIPQEKQDFLFDSFTQVDASTTRQYGGTGLGLAIVKQLCHLMGGTIQVHSQVEQGSCFEVTIPLRASTIEIPTLPKLPLQNVTVLLLEDHEMMLQILTEQLQQQGANVLCASDLNQAQNLCQPLLHSPQISDTKIDLAIVDEHLLDNQGVEWVNTLQKHPSCPDLAVIRMTSVNDRILTNAPNLAERACLVKPVTPRQLTQVLSQIYGALSPLPHFDPQQNLPTEAPENPWDPSTRLLVVEDSTINQAVIHGFLEVLGLQADCAENGQVALEVLRQSTQTPYPLILMDCQMPELDGYETTRKIRQGLAGECYRQVPIIALTAHAMPSDRAVCLAAGMNDYLVKPLALRDLDRTLRRWLDRSPQTKNSTPSWSFPNPKPNSLDRPATEVPLFDHQGLLDRAEGHLDLAQKMCQRFLEGVPQSLQELRTLLNAEDIQTINLTDVERYAHRLKGSSSLIGAEFFRQQAARIEEIAKKNDRADLPQIMEMAQALMIRFAQTKAEIDRWITPEP